MTLELQPLLKKGQEMVREGRGEGEEEEGEEGKKGQEIKGGARVVMVTSAVHSSAEFDPSNMNGERCYSRFMAYYNSKLYNVSTFLPT